MATETALTTQEAIRILDGATQYLPPGPAEQVKQVLLRAFTAEGEAKTLANAIAAHRDEVQRVRADLEVAQQALQSTHATQADTQRRLAKEQEELASVQNSVAARRALLGRADDLLASVQKFIGLFRT